MTQSLVLGALLGFFSGVVPGPFSALVAATALERGFWTGFKVAVVPLASEVAVLALTAAFLTQVPDQALGWMGMAGGLLVVGLAWRTYRQSGEPPEAEALEGTGMRLVEGALLAVLSPAPWVFWLLVGSPLFLASWRSGWAEGIVFLGSFLLLFVGVYVAIAGAAGLGHHRLSGSAYRRVMRGTAAALLVAGGVLFWQSWEGNFQEMVVGSETVRSMVEEELR